MNIYIIWIIHIHKMIIIFKKSILAYKFILYCMTAVIDRLIYWAFKQKTQQVSIVSLVGTALFQRFGLFIF